MKGKIRTYRKGKLLIGLTCLSTLLFFGCQPKQEAVSPPVDKISAVQVIEDLKASKKPTEHNARKLLIDLVEQKKLEDDVLRLVKVYPDMSAYLFAEYARGVEPADAMKRGIEYKYDTDAMLELTYLISPEDKIILTQNLYFSRVFEFDDIARAAVNAGLDPSQTLPATAAGTDTYRITPLIESASITIYNRKESDTAKVQYRKAGTDEWFDGMDLLWEPRDSALSGSIVYLTADTKYEAKVTVTSNGIELEPATYTFTTWPDKPPIDPNKVYYLSDIYSGGVLNLSHLGITGSPTGWAKIVGDPDNPIDTRAGTEGAVFVGSGNNYIYFENVTVRGGARFGIYAYNTHHLWINGCDISGWGRSPNYIKNGLSYENSTDSEAINYDGGIYINYTGTVVIENCKIHSPVPGANSWGYGHPHGPSAVLMRAQNGNTLYEGQVVIRNNEFFGTHDKRYNDVIESKVNGDVKGGFVRDSAIYNNYMAYSNDDIIEIDGGQNNVMFYNNEITQGYCGISVIPTVKGPAYVFNNYVHDLGDDRGETYASIKIGGLLTRPEGMSNIFNNFFRTSSNGITAASFSGDINYWTNVANNIFVHNQQTGVVGYSIYHKGSAHRTATFTNNYMYHLGAQKAVIRMDPNTATLTDFYDPSLVNYDKASSIWNTDANHVSFAFPEKYQIPNITRFDSDGLVIVGNYSDDAKAMEPEAEETVTEEVTEEETVVEQEEAVTEVEESVVEPEEETTVTEEVTEETVTEEVTEESVVDTEEETVVIPEEELNDIRKLIEQRKQEALERIEQRRKEALELIEKRKQEALQRIEQQN